MNSFKHNNKDYPLTITRKRVKNVNLRISSSKGINISIPFNLTEARLESFLKEKELWIRAHLDKIEQVLASRDNNIAVSEDVFWLLGKKYDCVYTEELAKDARIVGNEIILYRPPGRDNYLPHLLLKKIIITEAVEQITNAYERVKPLAKSFTPKNIEVHIRPTISKWGTCYTKKAKIHLSYYLIHFPIECIEYIIIHELCHFKYPNHGKQFHSLVESLIPNWKELNLKLRDPQIHSSFLDLKGFGIRIK